MQNKHMNYYLVLMVFALMFFLGGCNSLPSTTGLMNKAIGSAGVGESGTGVSSGSSAAATYTNTDRKFSFVIPAGWSKQSGDVNSDSVLFMKVPIASTCSFQFHLNRMQLDFPAEASVSASLKSAKKDIQIDKNLSAKRRDESGKENNKTVRFTRGWELVEKGKAGGHQRIIYQAYDRENYYMNFMGAAETEHFEECRPELKEIVDSIKFGD